MNLVRNGVQMSGFHALRVYKFVHWFLPLSRHLMVTATEMEMTQMEQKEEGEDETDCDVISFSSSWHDETITFFRL